MHDNLPGSGLDVGPPAQEELDGLQVTILGSIVESSGTMLSETHTDRIKPPDSVTISAIYIYANIILISELQCSVKVN